MERDAVFRDDPDRVRQRLLECADCGDWYVFETISADGSLAIGIAEGEPNPGSVMLVYEHLSRSIAIRAAQGLVDWYRDRGRNVGTGPSPDW